MLSNRYCCEQVRYQNRYLHLHVDSENTTNNTNLNCSTRVTSSSRIPRPFLIYYLSMLVFNYVRIGLHISQKYYKCKMSCFSVRNKYALNK